MRIRVDRPMAALGQQQSFASLSLDRLDSAKSGHWRPKLKFVVRFSELHQTVITSVHELKSFP